MRGLVALLLVCAGICLATRALAQPGAEKDVAGLRRECAEIESSLSADGERLLALGRRLDELRRDLAEPGRPDVERRVLREQQEQLLDEQKALARAIVVSKERLGACRTELDAAEAKASRPTPPPARTVRKAAPPPRRAARPARVYPTPEAPASTVQTSEAAAPEAPTFDAAAPEASVPETPAPAPPAAEAVPPPDRTSEAAAPETAAAEATAAEVPEPATTAGEPSAAAVPEPAPASGRTSRIPAGDAAALVRALSAAGSGDTIALAPGRYHARLILRLDARIVGEGRTPGETVIAAGDDPAAVVEAGSPHLENLTLESGDAPAVVVTGGSPRLARVGLTSKRSHGLIVRGEARPVVECSVLRAGGNGARFEERASGRLDHCDVTDSGLAAIAVLGQAAPEVTANLITGGDDAGILLEAGGLVEANVARGCKLSGIEARGGARAVVRANTVEDAGLHGILVHDGAGGVFERNEVRGSRQAGMATSSSARPRFVGNVARDGRAEGLLCYGADTSAHEAGSLLSNAGPGLALRDEADPIVSGFVVAGSSPAVSVSGRARGRLESLRLSGEGAPTPEVGLDVSGEATTAISGCRIEGFKTGMLVRGGTPRLSGIEIGAGGEAAKDGLSP